MNPSALRDIYKGGKSSADADQSGSRPAATGRSLFLAVAWMTGGMSQGHSPTANPDGKDPAEQWRGHFLAVAWMVGGMSQGHSPTANPNGKDPAKQ